MSADAAQDNATRNKPMKPLLPLTAVSSAAFEEGRYYSYAEVAKLGGVPKSTVKTAALRGSIPVRRFGHRTPRILGLHVLQFLGIAVVK
jgi:hypothetical protein